MGCVVGVLLSIPLWCGIGVLALVPGAWVVAMVALALLVLVGVKKGMFRRESRGVGHGRNQNESNV